MFESLEYNKSTKIVTKLTWSCSINTFSDFKGWVICLDETEDCYYSTRFCTLDDSEGAQKVFQTLTQSATKPSRHFF
jgi:hypothetical protein